ncbi:unnamed protein product [Coccothraustes coccothraustes]
MKPHEQHASLLTACRRLGCLPACLRARAKAKLPSAGKLPPPAAESLPAPPRLARSRAPENRDKTAIKRDKAGQNGTKRDKPGQTETKRGRLLPSPRLPPGFSGLLAIHRSVLPLLPLRGVLDPEYFFSSNHVFYKKISTMTDD